MWSGVLILLVSGAITVCGRSPREIDLSFRGITKEMFFVKLQHTLNFHEMTHLNLKGNLFDSFMDCLTQLDHLKSLDLAENKLQRFIFLCSSEYALEYLNISYNHLEYIDDMALNKEVRNLKILDMSHNQISVINETMIEHLKALEFLSIAHNPVVDIHEKAFITQKSLKHLDLANINAAFFPGSLFRPLTNLTFLNLSCNPIVTIPFLPATLLELDISGTLILYPDDIILPHLMRLHLNAMPNVTGVVLNDFENTTMLKVLSMVRCPILSEFRVWLGNNRILPRLHQISLRGCGLETLNDDLRPIMQRLAIMDLQHNRWHCDCRMQWGNQYSLSSELGQEITCVNFMDKSSTVIEHDICGRCCGLLDGVPAAIHVESLLEIPIILIGINSSGTAAKSTGNSGGPLRNISDVEMKKRPADLPRVRLVPWILSILHDTKMAIWKFLKYL